MSLCSHNQLTSVHRTHVLMVESAQRDNQDSLVNVRKDIQETDAKWHQVRKILIERGRKGEGHKGQSCLLNVYTPTPCIS